jgi:hypothetical protein
MGQV